MKPRSTDQSESKSDSKSDSYSLILARTDSRKESHEVKQQKQKTNLTEGAADAFDNSKTAAILALPTVTAGGIAMMCDKGHGIGSDIFNVFGFFMAVSGLIIDPIKAPIALVVSAEEAVKGSIKGIGALITEKNPEKKLIKKVYDSFIDKMKKTADLLIAFNLETKENLAKKIQALNIEELVGMTLLYTAYHSRYRHDGILLSNDKVFTHENCPLRFRTLFNRVNALKETIRTGLKIDDRQGTPDEEKSLEDAKVVAGWLKHIKEGVSLESSAHTADDHTPKIVNQVIEQIKALREVAMLQLPEETDKVVHRLGKR